MNEEESVKIFSKGFEEFYIKILATVKCKINPNWTIQFFEYVKELGKDRHITYCKPPNTYSAEFLEKIKDTIVCYSYMPTVNCYFVICQFSRTFNVLLSFSLVGDGKQTGLTPLFAFEDPEDFLKFREDNKNFEQQLFQDKKAGFSL